MLQNGDYPYIYIETTVTNVRKVINEVMFSLHFKIFQRSLGSIILQRHANTTLLWKT